MTVPKKDISNLFDNITPQQLEEFMEQGFDYFVDLVEDLLKKEPDNLFLNDMKVMQLCAKQEFAMAIRLGRQIFFGGTQETERASVYLTALRATADSDQRGLIEKERGVFKTVSRLGLKDIFKGETTPYLQLKHFFEKEYPDPEPLEKCTLDNVDNILNAVYPN